MTKNTMEMIIGATYTHTMICYSVLPRTVGRRVLAFLMKSTMGPERLPAIYTSVGSKKNVSPLDW